jgi:excisionase family DNA binding protein
MGRVGVLEATIHMDDERLLTVPEVAERLRVHPETVRVWLRQGKLKGIRIGGTKAGYRIPSSELDRLLGGSGAEKA